MENKRPFKSNILIRYFRKTGLPKNWLILLKEIGELIDKDPKAFSKWNHEIQLATVFIAKGGFKVPSKKNFFKLSNELKNNSWMIGFLNNLNQKDLIETEKLLSRPKLLKEILQTKNKKDFIEYNSTKKDFLKYNVVWNETRAKIYKSMISVVRENEIKKYISNIKHYENIIINPFESSLSTLSGKAGSITWKIEKSYRTFFLDSASDCCQGLGKAGAACMFQGHKEKNSSFLLFERKNKIFAQAWITEYKDVLILDSIESKGEVNESLVIAILSAVKEIKKHVKHVVIGISPNTDGNSLFKLLMQYAKRENKNDELIKNVVYTHKKLSRYTDLERGYEVL